jgi:hypothetical protein
MKRPWLFLSVATLVVGLVAAGVGVRSSLQRIFAQAELRAQRKAEGKTEAYLAEIESANRPAIIGLAVAGACSIGAIVAFAAHRRERRELRTS